MARASNQTATTVTRDDIAPAIKVLEPTQTVYTDNETLIGTTEPGADIKITDGAGHEIESSINGDGRFSATLTLHGGDNNLTLQSTDIAGNHASTTYTVVRGSSLANIVLTVTPTDALCGEPSDDDRSDRSMRATSWAGQSPTEPA